MITDRRDLEARIRQAKDAYTKAAVCCLRGDAGAADLATAALAELVQARDALAAHDRAVAEAEQGDMPG